MNKSKAFVGVVVMLLGVSWGLVQANDEADAALMQAVVAGDQEKVSHWLGQGADPNVAQRPWELTPLLVAVAGDVEIVDRLIEAGADVNAREREGVTVLMKAVHGGQPDVVERLLREDDLEVDAAGPRGTTALAYATLYGYPTMVEALLGAGADPQHVRYNGTTPVSLAEHMHELALAMPEEDAGGHHGEHDHGADEGPHDHYRSRNEAVASYDRIVALLDAAPASEDSGEQCHHNRAGDPEASDASQRPPHHRHH
ncbi:Ankyrin [Thioalkalivibrio sp. K90mix]|uniref:ankyrin repeat domain-containing protein n=1 Tax=unclassified Thioalkalivibrio TaxID=2621013 RepID=UPI000195A41A|nr:MULTISPECIES: ankyrin repeat domain-containing protein [unclassified Thioalkalivibrio]ADC72106.1 Ankyrin [Thioalkalivibrio sp. K90mix]